MNYVEFPDNGQQQKGSNDDNNRLTRSANGGGPWLWGLVFAMLFLLFLNVIISPAFMRKHVIETDYGTFVSKVEQDSITEVVIQDSRIILLINRYIAQVPLMILTWLTVCWRLIAQTMMAKYIL